MIGFALVVCLLFPSSFPVKLPRSAGKGAEMSRMLAVDFEVFGVVQGVFFRKVSKPTCARLEVRRLTAAAGNVIGEANRARTLRLLTRDIYRYTQKRGRELGLKGWCMNTPNGTVVGHLEGEKAQIEEMKQWLRHTGSPQSRIDKAEFRNEKEISQPSFSNFEIRK